MMKEISPNIGFQSVTPKSISDVTTRLESIALGAVRKRFSPEFVNRIDAVVTYNPLDAGAIEIILDHDLRALQDHVNLRLGDRYFSLDISTEAKQFLLQRGISQEYGARELKRTIHRQLTQPLATMVARGEILPGARVSVLTDDTNESLSIVCTGGGALAPRQTPTILIVDDNHDLLCFLSGALRDEGWEILTAENGLEARLAFDQGRPAVVLIDLMLGEDNGLKLGLEFQTYAPQTHIILMTGGGFSDELLAWEERDLPVLYKPFLAQDVINLVRGRIIKSIAAGAA